MIDFKLDFVELKKLDREVLIAELEKKLEAYKEDLAKNILTYEEAQEEEKRVVEAQDEFSDYLDNVVYTFTGGISVNGKPIKNTEVFEYIQYFINKMEVEFQYTKGLMEMFEFWGANPKQVNYAVLESTLRTLQTCKFKGHDQWVKIMAINDFFAAVRGESIKDTAFQMYYAQVHNAVIDRAALLNPVKETEEPVEE